MLNEILVGRINRYVQKLLVIKNTALRSLQPDLQLILPLFSGVEERYLQGWNRYATTATITGGAGAHAIVQVHNPSNSGVIGVIEKIDVAIGPATASIIIVSLTAGPAIIADFTVSQVVKIDGRSNTNSSMIFSTSTAGAGTGNNIMQGTVNNAGTYQFLQMPDQQFPLLPGSAIVVLDNTVAETCAFSIAWRERSLESSELT